MFHANKFQTKTGVTILISHKLDAKSTVVSQVLVVHAYNPRYLGS
jgi:hypothetical protein